MANNALREAISAALEAEENEQVHTEQEIKLFAAVRPLKGLALNTVRIAQLEREKKKSLLSSKNRLQLVRQQAADKVKSPSTWPLPLVLPDSGASGLPQESLEENDDDNHDTDKEGCIEDNSKYSAERIAQSLGADLEQYSPSSLRQSCIQAGVRPQSMMLDWMAILPRALSLSRLKHELLATPYKGEPCIVFAIRPSPLQDSPWKKDCDLVARTIKVLLKAQADENRITTLSKFVGAVDYKEHVIIALRCPGRTSLHQMASAAATGLLRISSGLQIALAMDIAMAVKALHRLSIVHGGISSETVVVSFLPSKATLIFCGPAASPPSYSSDSQDVYELGLCFATLALRRVVTANTLPDVSELRAAACDALDPDPPLPSFMELIAQMTLNKDMSLRPSSEEVVDWLDAICVENGLNDSAELRHIDVSDSMAAGKLDVAAFPLRPFL